MNAPTFTTFANYNAQSSGLLGPLRRQGYCLRNERLDVDTDDWYDFEAPLHSGDVVALFLDTPSGPMVRGKWLQYDRAGRWYAVSYATRDERSLCAIPLDHGGLRIGGIAALVATMETARSVPAEPASDSHITPATLLAFDQLGGEAVALWAKHGFPPRRKMAFANPPENLEVIRSIWCNKQ
jgi:hypothetical protein